MALGVIFDIFAKDKTGQAFDQVKNKVRQLDDSFAKLKKTAVLFGGGAAVFNWLKGAAEGAEHINDLSIRLGIGADVLSQYQLVAGETGVELDSIAKGMQLLAKNSIEAASGSGAASEALAKLGIDAATFKNLSIDQQFAMVADKIQGVESPAQRVSIAMALMGKSGAEMLQVMDGGGQSLLEMQRKADALGITLDNTTTGSIDSMMDAFGDLGLQVMALGQHLLAKFAPILEFIAEVLQTVLAGAIIIVRDGFKAMVQVILNAIGAIAKGLGWLTEQLSVLPGEVGESFKSLSASLKDYGDILTSVNADTDTLVKNQKKLKPVFDDTAAGFEKINKASKKIDKNVKLPWLDAKKDIDDLTDHASKGALDMQGAFEGALRGIGSDFKSLKDVARSVITNITDQLLQMGINGLSNSIFGGGQQLPWLAGSGGGGGLGSILGSIGNFFGGFFADGGTMQPGKWGVVGENGPELVTSGNAPLSVFPNVQAQSGGTQIVYQIDARGAAPGVENSILRALKQVDQSIESRAVMAVANAKKRNPALL